MLVFPLVFYFKLQITVMAEGHFLTEAELALGSEG